MLSGFALHSEEVYSMNQRLVGTGWNMREGPIHFLKDLSLFYCDSIFT